MKVATLRKNGSVTVGKKVIGEVRITKDGRYRAYLGYSRTPTQSSFSTVRAAAEVVALNANAVLN